MTPTVTVGAFGALGSQAPSFRVRTRIPSAELRRLGVEVRHYPLLDEREDAAFHGGSAGRRLQVALSARRRLRRRLGAVDSALDVTMIQRQVDLLPGLRLERLAMGNRRVVLDIDDAIWLDRSPHAGGHRLAALKGTPRKVRWLASRADTVVAGNELLAEWLAQYSRDVVVVPSLVEHREIAPREHQQGDRIVLGWIGSASTAPSLQRLTEPLRRFARESDQPLELLAVGGRPPRLEAVQVRYEPWSEPAEHEFLRSVDIGLMPLADNEWTRGKCSYKALQYMAAGIPVVADDVGISARVIGHEVGGLVARDSADWTDHLRALAADTDLRAELGAGGRARVARDFSVEAWAPKLAEVLQGDR